jgi:Phosphodiester glycosidase
MACGRGFNSPRFHHTLRPPNSYLVGVLFSFRRCWRHSRRLPLASLRYPLIPIVGLLAALLLALLTGCATPPATLPAAHLPWRSLAPGLHYAAFSPAPGAQLHALRLDLQNTSLRLQLSPHALRGQTVPQLHAAAQALVSFNASFYDRQFTPRGTTVSDGQAWPAVLVPHESPALACDAAQRCRVFFDGEPQGSATAPWRIAVAGTPWLVRDGQARTVADDASCPGLCAHTHPRTAVALTEHGRYLLVVLAEGRRPGVPGVSLAALAAWLRDMGAREAINLDGGGSSSLWVQGQALMQRPANEPAERAVANALHVLTVLTVSNDPPSP